MARVNIDPASVSGPKIFLTTLLYSSMSNNIFKEGIILSPTSAFYIANTNNVLLSPESAYTYYIGYLMPKDLSSSCYYD